MYGGGNKTDGSIIGVISKGDEVIDLSDAAEITAAEETLLGMDSSGDLIAINSRISPISGELTWDSYSNVADAYIRTVSMSQMTSMLRDYDRNTIYQQAINIAINHYISTTKIPPRILDIGTGTGLLACLCAKSGAGSVTGCEMFSPMACIASNIVAENNFSDIITIIEGKSTNLEVDDINEEGYDMIVSELLDSSLLGESVIPTHADAISRLIRRNSNVSIEDRVVPHSATIYIALIESPSVKNMVDVDAIGGQDFIPYRNEEAQRCIGGWPAIPVHLNKLPDMKFLSDYKDAVSMEFFHTDVGSQVMMIVEVDAISTGIIHGISMAWDLFLLSPELDPERKIKYSSRPDQQNWQDHWLQMVYPLPQPISCKASDKLRIAVHHDHIHTWVQLLEVISDNIDRHEKKPRLDDMSEEDADAVEPAQCSCGWHMLCSAERLQTLNDPYRQLQWSHAIDILVSRIISSLGSIAAPDNIKSIIYDVSDGSTLSLMLNRRLSDRNNTMRDTSNFSEPSLSIISRERKQFSYMFHQQLADANICRVIDEGTGIAIEEDTMLMIWDGNDWQDVLDFKSNTIDDDNDHDDEKEVVVMMPDSIKITCLISECFSYQLHALPLQQAVSFYHQRKSLINNMSYPPHHPQPIIMPSAAKIMMVPIQLTELQQAHGPVGHVLGFTHTTYDNYIRDSWHHHNYPYKLGNYHKVFLADPICIASLDYVDTAKNTWYESHGSGTMTKPIIEQIAIHTAGICHAVAIWVDYHLIDDVTLNICHHQDFPLYYNVSVKFLPKPMSVDQSSVIQASLSTKDTDILFDVKIM